MQEFHRNTSINVLCSRSIDCDKGSDESSPALVWSYRSTVHIFIFVGIARNAPQGLLSFTYGGEHTACEALPDIDGLLGCHADLSVDYGLDRGKQPRDIKTIEF